MRHALLALLLMLAGCASGYVNRPGWHNLDAIRAMRGGPVASGPVEPQPLLYPEPVRHVAFGVTAGEAAAVIGQETPIGPWKRYQAVGVWAPAIGPNAPRVNAVNGVGGWQMDCAGR